MISTSDAFAAVQGLLGTRVFARMLATAAGDPVVATTEVPPDAGTIVAIVPVLDEAERLGPCLDGLVAQPAALTSIIVVDGGSTDLTRDIVRSYRVTRACGWWMPVRRRARGTAKRGISRAVSRPAIPKRATS